MEPLNCYPMEPGFRNHTLPLQSYLTAAYGDYLDRLWRMSCLGDLDAFENLHNLLYPYLFKYIYFFLQDESAADAMLMGTFLDFWNLKTEIVTDHIRMHLAKEIRSCVLRHLSKTSYADWRPGAKLLTILNSYDFEKQERNFLAEYLRFDAKEIEEIIDR